MSNKNIKNFNLDGKIVVITGGAGLLGVMHAEAVGAVGGIPVLADIREQEAKEKAQVISTKLGIPTVGFGVDITAKKSVENLRDFLLEQYGKIDVLINNVANDPKVTTSVQDDSWTRFENYPLDIWENDLAVGLTGAFLCSQVLGSEMAKQASGVILNISSDLGVIAPDQRLYQKEGVAPDRQPVKPVTYSIVKTGLIGLTRYLATYWADRNVRVNALCPGGVDTGQPEEFKEQVHFRIPMGRMARRDEYKGAVQFLVSDASSYMTGSTLVVDGGRSCW